MFTTPIRAISKRLQDNLLTSTDLCASCLSRAETIRKLQAFVRLTRITASNQATESWSRYKNGKGKGVLDGIPIAVKDNFCTRYIPTTCGSKMLENFVPTYNATVVQKLEDAGTVLIGKCNMDEFGMGSGTVDSIHGPTKNIWGSSINYSVTSKHRTYYHHGDKADPIRRVHVGEKANHAGNYLDEDSSDDADWFIAGGSSGGSAVAVAAGSVFAALGSDTGGSTRNPAAYCGVVGLKPTYGLVSRHGLIPLVNSMDAPSILARCIDDVAVVLNCIAGPDKLDSTTVFRAHRPVDLSAELDMKTVTVGIPKEFYCPGMSHEVVQTWTNVAGMLEKAGAKVQQVSMPHTQDSIVCYSILNQVEVASNMARYDGIEFGLRAEESRSTEQLYAASRSSGFNDVVRSRILGGNYFLLQRNYDKYFVKALKVRRLIANDFKEVWSRGIDVLLTPTTLTDAPLFSDFVRSDNRSQCATQDFCTQPANMAGCPALSLPINLSEKGLPLSLQLMSKNFDEQKLLSVAKWIEQNVDFPQLHIEL